jgi:hypothetical protein
MTTSIKPIALLALGLAIAGSASIALAQTPPPGGGQPGAPQARIDVNGDGVIDRSEAAKVPRLAENFDRLDADKDGRISAEERPRRGGREGGRRDGGKGRGGERMAQLDTNGDGRFSRDELAGRERALQNFAAIDTNKDGFLTREEMKAHHQAQRGERKPKQ